MVNATLIWWVLLCTVSSINVLAWIASAASLRRRFALLHPGVWAAARLQMILSAGYVLGCAYRSVFPVFDVRRLCLVDSWMSSVIVGRSVATLAEMCFAAQWALWLRFVAKETGHPIGLTVSRLVVPLIAVAEVCSWYAVLTTSNIGHVFEESIWGMCAGLLVVSLVLVWPQCTRQVRPLLAAVCAVGLGYVIYMFEVDVPMYWSRWIFDMEHAHPVLSIAQGVVDASGRWIVSSRWADWKSEVVWMSLYFSVAVWFSIGLIHLPSVFVSANAAGPRRTATRRPIGPAVLRPDTLRS